MKTIILSLIPFLISAQSFLILIDDGVTYLDETLAYQTRVEADGGSIIDIAAVDAFYKYAVANDFLDTLRVWCSHTYGVKKDANGKVTKLYTLIGTEDIVNADTSKCPTHTLSVKNGLPGGGYDGTDDYLTIAYTGLSQPETIFMVGKMVFAGAGDRIWDGNSYTSMSCYYINSTSMGLRGNVASSAVDATDNTWYIINAIFSGADSKLKLNDGTDNTLSVGPTAGCGIIIGAGATNGTNASASTICEFGLSGTRMSDTMRNLIKTFLNTKYAIY